jgi:hypothetical protein
VSFILDCWTSATQVAYHGVLARWVDGKNVHETILDMDILNGSHTGENLAGSFIRVLTDFNCLEKIISVTTDNASNCDTFFVKLTEELKGMVRY